MNGIPKSHRIYPLMLVWLNTWKVITQNAICFDFDEYKNWPDVGEENVDGVSRSFRQIVDWSRSLINIIIDAGSNRKTQAVHSMRKVR